MHASHSVQRVVYAVLLITTLELKKPQLPSLLCFLGLLKSVSLFFWILSNMVLAGLDLLHRDSVNVSALIMAVFDYMVHHEVLSKVLDAGLFLLPYL